MNPPRSLAPFAVEALPARPGRAAFKIACATCGETAFRIWSFPKVVPDPSPYAVNVSFGYDIEWDELAEEARGDGVDPADLFDSIVIMGRALDGAADFLESYECA